LDHSLGLFDCGCVTESLQHPLALVDADVCPSLVVDLLQNGFTFGAVEYSIPLRQLLSSDQLFDPHFQLPMVFLSDPRKFDTCRPVWLIEREPEDER
jgi:hypothetical protein